MEKRFVILLQEQLEMSEKTTGFLPFAFSFISLLPLFMLPDCPDTVIIAIYGQENLQLRSINKTVVLINYKIIPCFASAINFFIAVYF